MKRSVLALLCVAAVAPAQPPRVPSAAQAQERVMALLEDADRDEAREVAARYFAALPESPAAWMRPWLDSKDWRRRQLALRVLGERGELSADELRRGLTSTDWMGRLAAARAASWASRDHDLRGDLIACFDDRFDDVARAALASLERRAELDDATLRRALEVRSLRAAASRLIAARPRRKLALLDDSALAGQLDLLVGARFADDERARLRRLASQHPSLVVRCRAMLCLPRAKWPTEWLSTLFDAWAGSSRVAGLADRLAGLLSAEDCARLLPDVFGDDQPRRARARLEHGSRAGRDAGRALLARIDDCDIELLDDALRTLIRLRAPGLLAHARNVLDLRAESFKAKRAGGEAGASADDEARLAAWVRQLGTRLARDPGAHASLHALLAAPRALAEASYRSLLDARHFAAPMLEFARSDLRYLGKLLQSPADVPLAFWLGLLRHEDEEFRWIAAKGLASRAHQPKVHRALLTSLYKEAQQKPRGALLASLLSGISAEAVGGVVSWVLERNDKMLERRLIEFGESSKAAWVDAALDRLARSRLAGEVRVVRASRGHRASAREILARADRLPSAHLRRARKGIASSLVVDDVPRLTALLAEGARGDEFASEVLREEILAWLRARPDLPATDALLALWKKSKDDALRELCVAALVERGRIEFLQEALARWRSKTSQDDGGMLLELIGALPERLESAHVDFAVAMLVAPMTRDAVASVRFELLQARRGELRIAAEYPLLRPTIAILARVDPGRFKKALTSALRNAELRVAWTCASKEYLLQALRSSVRARAEVVLEPLIEWAARLGVRGHSADAGLAWFEARAHVRGGRYAAAALRGREALTALMIQGVPARRLESLVRDLEPESSGPPLAVLRARIALWEALASTGPRRLRHLEHALFAAREDRGLSDEIRGVAARLAKRAGAGGRLRPKKN